MTSKQRAYLKGLAMTTEPVLQIGKSSLTPEFTRSAEEALEARELIKISVLQNCLDDPRELAQVLAERTGAQVVQVIGKKIVLYREGKKDKKKDRSAESVRGFRDGGQKETDRDHGRHLRPHPCGTSDPGGGGLPAVRTGEGLVSALPAIPPTSGTERAGPRTASGWRWSGEPSPEIRIFSCP